AMFSDVRLAVVIGLSSAILTALVTEIYCHRALAHRAFRVHPVVASVLDTYFRVIVWTDPESWAAVHRWHHRHADTPLDPHSPRQRPPLAILLGSSYLFAMARRRLPADPPPGRGIVALRALAIAVPLGVLGLVPFLTSAAVHLVCYLGIMGMVNTVGHLHGRNPHPDVPGYDLAWLAIPLLGHGYHNSHHAHPAAARTGLLDPIWPLLRLLSAVGLVDLEDRHAHERVRECCRAATYLAPVSGSADHHSGG
ncbi:MAG: fatty acid desaturase, partial [Actinomycetota bacterium]|nr:fatty acid desaturase [Actinomycetota bacterium]